MNLADLPTEPDHPLPQCHECGQRHFRQPARGRFAEDHILRTYPAFDRQGRPTGALRIGVDYDTQDWTVEETDAWECERGHIQTIETQLILQERWIDNE